MTISISNDTTIGNSGNAATTVIGKDSSNNPTNLTLDSTSLLLSAGTLSAVGLTGTIPAVRAYASASNQTIATATATKIVLDGETFDTNNNFASNRFTPTVAGTYAVTGTMQITGVIGAYIVTLQIYKNGSAYSSINMPLTFAVANYTVTISDLVSCNGSTDYIELYVTQTSVGDLVVNKGSALTILTAIRCA